MLGKRFVAPAVAAIAALCVPVSGNTQRSDAPKIGFLSPFDRPAAEEAFWSELRRLGHAEGSSISVVYRSAGGDFDRLPALAAELVAARVDVIVAYVTQASLAARAATDAIPIVMVGVSDPVRSGLVASLARPGGNVTGTSAVAAGVAGKQLELLHELRPGASRVAVLWNPANRVFQQQQLAAVKSAAAGLRMQVQLFEARAAHDLDRVFAMMSHERHEAVLVTGDPLFTAHARQAANLAIEHRLVAVGASSLYAEAGFLAAYGPDYRDAYRRAASYVDRILKGTKPSDLPVEQSTKFELLVNMKTARSLAIAIPTSVTVRADRLID